MKSAGTPEEFSGKDILKAFGGGDQEEHVDGVAGDPELNRLKTEFIGILRGHANDPTTGITFLTIDTAPRGVVDMMTRMNGGKLPNIAANGFIVLAAMPLPLVAEIAKTVKRMMKDQALLQRLSITAELVSEEEHGREL